MSTLGDSPVITGRSDLANPRGGAEDGAGNCSARGSDRGGGNVYSADDQLRPVYNYNLKGSLHKWAAGYGYGARVATPNNMVGERAVPTKRMPDSGRSDVSFGRPSQQIHGADSDRAVRRHQAAMEMLTSAEFGRWTVRQGGISELRTESAPQAGGASEADASYQDLGCVQPLEHSLPEPEAESGPGPKQDSARAHDLSGRSGGQISVHSWRADDPPDRGAAGGARSASEGMASHGHKVGPASRRGGGRLDPPPVYKFSPRTPRVGLDVPKIMEHIKHLDPSVPKNARYDLLAATGCVTKLPGVPFAGTLASTFGSASRPATSAMPRSSRAEYLFAQAPPASASGSRSSRAAELPTPALPRQRRESAGGVVAPNTYPSPMSATSASFASTIPKDPSGTTTISLSILNSHLTSQWSHNLRGMRY